jgi:hypothetical protein
MDHNFHTMFDPVSLLVQWALQGVNPSSIYYHLPKLYYINLIRHPILVNLQSSKQSIRHTYPQT